MMNSGNNNGMASMQHSRTYLDKINLGEGISPPMHTTTQAEFKNMGVVRDNN